MLLEQGDIVRFGRIPFKVSCICMSFDEKKTHKFDGLGEIELPEDSNDESIESNLNLLDQ